MSQVLTSGFTSFPVRKLSEFKELELSSDQFLVRKIEKNTGKDSSGSVIPALSSEAFISLLDSDKILSHLHSCAQSLIEEVCKKKISSGATSLCLDDFSREELEKFLDEVEISQGRISKEKIASWFATEVAPIFSSALKAKFPEIQDSAIVQTCKLYSIQFSAFAKREHSFSKEVSQKIEKVLEIIPDSGMKKFCEKKLVEFSVEKVAEMYGL